MIIIIILVSLIMLIITINDWNWILINRNKSINNNINVNNNNNILIVGIWRREYKQVHYRNLNNYIRNKIILEIKKYNKIKQKDYYICYKIIHKDIIIINRIIIIIKNIILIQHLGIM